MLSRTSLFAPAAIVSGWCQLVRFSRAAREQALAPRLLPAIWLHRPYRVVVDTGGRLAHRFGAATSGEIVLNSPIRAGCSSRAESLRNAPKPATATALAPGAPRSSPATRLPSQPDSVFGSPIFRLEQAG